MSDISREKALAHFGVKGMKWGVRNNGSSGSSAPSRKELRGMNKVARKENRVIKKEKARKAVEDRDNEIKAARDALSKERSNYKAAKATYKVEKKQIGRVAAKRSLHEAGERLWDTRQTASQKTAREQQWADAVNIGVAVTKSYAASRS